MDSSSPPQNDGTSSYTQGSSSSGSNWSNQVPPLRMKLTKNERKKDKKDKNEIITVLDEDRHESNSCPSDPSQKKIAKWRIRERVYLVFLFQCLCFS